MSADHNTCQCKCGMTFDFGRKCHVEARQATVRDCDTILLDLAYNGLFDPVLAVALLHFRPEKV